MINEENIVRDCPQCGEDETWEHVLLCRENHHRRAEFIYNLEQKLSRVNRAVELQHIAMMITNIRTYLTQYQQDFNTNQQYIGIKNLFQGYVAKV